MSEKNRQKRKRKNEKVIKERKREERECLNFEQSKKIRRNKSGNTKTKICVKKWKKN